MSKLTIWKYTLNITDYQDILMPRESEILTCQIQNGHPQLWVRVNPTSPECKRIIRIVGTGHNMQETGKYINTFQVGNGQLVFHVFDLGFIE